MTHMSEFYIQNILKMLPEMTKNHRTLQSGLDHNSKFSLGLNKIIRTPNQREVAWKTMPTFPKKWTVDCFLKEVEVAQFP